jgi:hypothetical protein
LYNLYAADMPRRPGTEFAGDTAAFTPNKNITKPSTALNNLQKCVSDLESWIYKWKVNINTDDGNAVIFTKGGKSRKQARNIRKRNSMIGRGTLFGHAPRKDLHMQSTH